MKIKNKFLTVLAILVTMVFVSGGVLKQAGAFYDEELAIAIAPCKSSLRDGMHAVEDPVSEMTEDVFEALIARGYFSTEVSLMLLSNEDPGQVLQFVASVRAVVETWMVDFGLGSGTGSIEGLTEDDYAVALELGVAPEVFHALKLMLLDSALVQEDGFHAETLEALEAYAETMGIPLEDLIDQFDDRLFDEEDEEDDDGEDDEDDDEDDDDGEDDEDDDEDDDDGEDDEDDDDEDDEDDDGEDGEDDSEDEDDEDGDYGDDDETDA